MKRQETGEKIKASRYTGVFRAGKKWKSQAQTNGVQHYLGIFDTEEEASAAYQCYKKSEGTHTNNTSRRTPREVKAVNPTASQETNPRVLTPASELIFPEILPSFSSLLEYLLPSSEPGYHTLRIPEHRLLDIERSIRLGRQINDMKR